MGKMIYASYTLAHLVLLTWGMLLFVQSPEIDLGILLLVLLGLVYDNLIIFVGDWLREGKRLESLNKLRYWFHGLFSPLLLVVAAQMLHSAHLNWDNPPLIDRLAWGGAIGLMVLEVSTRMVKLNLKPVTFAGTLRYKEVVPSKELPVILVIVLVGAVGMSVWQQIHYPWIFWGALIMLLGSAVPTTTKAGPSIGSGVEILFGLSLLMSQIGLPAQ